MASEKTKATEAQIHYQAAIKAAAILNKRGFEAYIIGGAVRDLLLGHLPKDFDVVTNARPVEILELGEIGQSKFHDSAQAFGVTRAVLEVQFRGTTFKSEIEIATYRRDIEAHLGRKATKIEFAHLEDDVTRRDLTVNALALDPLNSFLVDLIGGLDDLDKKLIRFIGDPFERIKEDPLRIIRAIRLRHQLGFTYESQTESALQQAIKLGDLNKIAQDRLRGELNRMLTHPSRVVALADLDNLGALEKLLPELAAAKGVAQPPQFHGEGDVFEHTLLALDSLPSQPSHQLVWATLLHDIGKPPTAAQRPGDRIRFDQHYKVGAEIAHTVLARFNFSKKDIENISWMVHNHMAIDDLAKMRPGHQRQMLAHPAFSDLFELHKADAHAAIGRAADGTLRASEPEFPEIEKLWEEHQLQAHTQPLTLRSQFGIDGHWLKKEFGISDGKLLGKVLDELNEKFEDGELKDLDQIKRVAQKLLGNR